MTRKRRSFRAEFKARVALEAIKNQHTLQEIASRFEVHPNQVAQWKRQALESLPEAFSKEIGCINRSADCRWSWSGLKKSREFRVEHAAQLDRAVASSPVDLQSMRFGGSKPFELVLPCKGRERGEPSLDAAAR